jgi:hypothetical protein
LTLGFDPTRFQTGPPACYRASWQLPGRDSHPLTTTSLCWITIYISTSNSGRTRGIELNTGHPRRRPGGPHVPINVSNAVRSSAGSPNTPKPLRTDHRRLATSRPRDHRINTREDLIFHPSLRHLVQRGDMERLIGTIRFNLAFSSSSSFNRFTSSAFIPPYCARHR